VKKTFSRPVNRDRVGIFNESRAKPVMVREKAAVQLKVKIDYARFTIWAIPKWVGLPAVWICVFWLVMIAQFLDPADNNGHSISYPPAFSLVDESKGIKTVLNRIGSPEVHRMLKTLETDRRVLDNFFFFLF